MPPGDYAEPYSPATYQDLPAGRGVIIAPKELRCLELCALGHSDAAVADLCGITRHTVRFHMHSLCRKLGAATRCQAIATAVRRGLI